MTVGSLFSGIGGLDLGLERAGMEVRWQCEIDPYCQQILRKHWPDTTIYGDIKELDSPESVDLICGGFPCQPVSLAGKGLAQADSRWLWPEFARVVGRVRPRYVLVENVPGLVKRGLSDVVGDLAAMGYDAEWQIVSAASVGAPHLRERVFVVAYTNHGDDKPGPLTRSFLRGQTEGKGADGDARSAGNNGGTAVADTASQRPSETLLQWEQASERPAADPGWWLTEPQVGRVADGVPDRVAQLRALGNAVVPQVAEFVGRLIMEAA